MNKKLLVPGLSALGVIAGIATGSGLGGLVANAATTSTSTSSTSSSTSTQTQERAQNGPHQYNGKTEAALTGSDLTKATAAAEKAVSGATTLRAETDVDGDGTYEVHMQKSDGTMVTVFLDANFTVTSTHTGMGTMHGGPQHQGNSSTSTQ